MTPWLREHAPGFLAVAFFTFRLVYIPVAMLSHSMHGLLWFSTLVALVLAFGGEWLGRWARHRPPSPAKRNSPQPPSTESGAALLTILLVALIFIGFFPQEGPVSLILWAGAGIAWGRFSPHYDYTQNNITRLFAAIPGILIGGLGLYGPASWVMAGLLGIGFWLVHQKSEI